MTATVTVSKRRCKARGMYPYGREWVVTIKQGRLVRSKNFEQDEQAARVFHAAAVALAQASGIEVEA